MSGKTLRLAPFVYINELLTMLPASTVVECDTERIKFLDISYIKSACYNNSNNLP